MPPTDFETRLTGGHPNSLGRTLEVVELVLADRTRLEELYACYASPDAVVRMRTSNAFKRIARAHPDWLVPYIDRFLDEISVLDQASAQWTLAQLCAQLAPLMDPQQFGKAQQVLQRYLENQQDWIVLNMTMQTLGIWAAGDPALRAWLAPHLERLTQDPRKSVAKKARRTMQDLDQLADDSAKRNLDPG
ncbi:MAG: hypothetical protein ACK2UW_15890 [Anaerolineales bacterium]|jgi:hypothetical protein